jgi:hypothetical protein
VKINLLFSSLPFYFLPSCSPNFSSPYGSGSDFWYVTLPVLVPAPVPVPFPYLDHKKLNFQKIILKKSWVYILSFFTRKKLISFINFIVKFILWIWIVKWKNVKLGKLNTQFLLHLWELLWFHFITVLVTEPDPVPLRSRIKLLLRFQFRYTAKFYGSYGSGSGSIALFAAAVYLSEAPSLPKLLSWSGEAIWMWSHTECKSPAVYGIQHNPPFSATHCLQ